jgi:hypothetical protein
MGEGLQEAISRHTWQTDRRLVVDGCGIWFCILLWGSWSKGVSADGGGCHYGSDGDELIRCLRLLCAFFVFPAYLLHNRTRPLGLKSYTARRSWARTAQAPSCWGRSVSTLYCVYLPVWVNKCQPTHAYA